MHSVVPKSSDVERSTIVAIPLDRALAVRRNDHGSIECGGQKQSCSCEVKRFHFHHDVRAFRRRRYWQAQNTARPRPHNDMLLGSGIAVKVKLSIKKLLPPPEKRRTEVMSSCELKLTAPEYTSIKCVT